MKRIIIGINMLLWKLGLLPNTCPYCKNRLIEYGYTELSSRDTYFTCKTKGCKFNEMD